MSSSGSTVAQTAALLLQTPPGQTSKVYHDLRVLLESSGQSNVSEQLKQAAQPVLEQYNTEQLITVKSPAATGEGAKADDKPLIIARAAAVPGQDARYAEPRAGVSYAFDHLRLALSDPKPLSVNRQFDKVRAAIDAKVSRYVADHYQDGVTSTFTVIKPDPKRQSSSASATASATVDHAKVAEEAAKSPAIPTAAEGVVNEESTDATTQVEPKADGSDAPESAAEAAKAEEESSASPETKEEAEKDDAIAAVKAMEEVQVSDSPEQPEDTQDEEPQGEPTFVTHIVGNRYNLANFWAGRWRASYTYSPGASESAVLRSSIQVQVHYFEDGNVQLAASKPAELPLDVPAPPSSGEIDDAAAEAVGKAIAAAISKHEQDYHKTLNDAYADLSEKTFKSIRRQLPVTKQKLDWDRALSYKLGAELSK